MTDADRARSIAEIAERCQTNHPEKWIEALTREFAEVRAEQRKADAEISRSLQPCDEATYPDHWAAYRVWWEERRATCLMIARAIESA